MKRKVQLVEDEYYHVYTRGVDGRDIFLDDNDRFRFLLLLYVCNSKKNYPLSRLFRLIATEKGVKHNEIEQRGVLNLTREELRGIFKLKREPALVDVLAYTLMPNHFHLVLKCRAKGGIGKFMQKIMTAYAMHFNVKYERVGPLFITPFRAKHLDKDPYFQHIFWYVHLNPVELVEPMWKERIISNRKTTETFVRTYEWSSYFDYVTQKDAKEKRPERAILETKDVMRMVSSIDSLKDALKKYHETNFAEEEAPKSWQGTALPWQGGALP